MPVLPNDGFPWYMHLKKTIEIWRKSELWKICFRFQPDLDFKFGL